MYFVGGPNSLEEIAWGQSLESSGISDTLMRIILLLNGCLGRGFLPNLFVLNQRNWVTR